MDESTDELVLQMREALLWIAGRRTGGMIQIRAQEGLAAADQWLAQQRSPLTDAARDVLAERRRQIEVEGWTPEHDDSHVNDEIAAAACFFAMPPGAREWDATSTGYGDTLGDAIVPDGWVLSEGGRRRDLVRAAALLLAEIERIDRANGIDRKAGEGKPC